MWLFFQFVTHLSPTIPRLSLSPILFARCVRVVCAFRLPMINHALNPTLHASPRHRPCRLPARPSVSCASPILVCGPSGHWICFALVFPLPSIDTSTTQLDPLSPLSVSTWCALASWLPFPSPSPTHAHAPPQRTHAPRRAHTMLFLVGLVGPCWPPQFGVLCSFAPLSASQFLLTSSPAVAHGPTVAPIPCLGKPPHQALLCVGSSWWLGFAFSVSFARGLSHRLEAHTHTHDTYIAIALVHTRTCTLFCGLP